MKKIVEKGIKKDDKLKKKSSIKKTTSRVKEITNKREIKNTKAKKVVIKKKFNKEDIIANIRPGKYTLDKAVSKKMKMILYFDKKLKVDIIDLFVLILATSIISCLVTVLLVSFYYKNNSIVYNDELAKDKDLITFINTYSSIVDNYYEDVDKKGMIEAATDGMMEHLADKYSIFLTEDEAESFDETLNNMYKGIGILSVENVVYEVYPDSPAEKVGIKVEDVIVRVNGTDINKDNFDLIDSLIKNNDSENEIVVLRGKSELTFNVSTDMVYKPSVEANVIEKNDKKIGYISLDAFTQKSDEEFELNLEKLEEKNIDSLIIDLRSNLGGYIDAAHNIASIFLEKGNVIYKLEKKDSMTTIVDETNELREYPIVILVNSSTASSSEILTAALKDNYEKLTIVGTRTYGKGKVQTVMKYDGSVVKYTSSKWFRPNGECVDEVGIEPDYVVENEMSSGLILDKQYTKAIELLSK